MSTSDVRELAESTLVEEFRRRLVADPRQALTMVEDLVLALHAEAMNATNYVLGSGVTWREIGRALALVDDAGILLRQAAALLLGLPAADRAAEQAMVDQALAEYEEQEDDGVGEWLAESGDREADIWAAAVDQFRRGTQPGSVATG